MISPADLGFRMPAEWEPHSGTWLTWPHRRETWPAGLGPIEKRVAQFAKALAEAETVHINVLNRAQEVRARKVLAEEKADGAIIFHSIPSNDAWARDHAAILVAREDGNEISLAATHWAFNGYGGKYPFDFDDEIPVRMAEALDIERFDSPMVLEGGSIDVDGRGLLATTETCLLNPNRNPGMSRMDIEGDLRRMLGVEKILWFTGEIAGDDTDGHVDNVARFVGEQTLLLPVEPDKTDENYHSLRENLDRAAEMTGVDGKRLSVVTIPTPLPVRVHGRRLAASYMNFYIGNEVVLMPAYGSRDDAAASILQSLFPSRQVVPIPCREVVWGGGSIHCLTQQIPAYSPARQSV